MLTDVQIADLKQKIVSATGPFTSLYIIKFPVGTNTTAGQTNADAVLAALLQIFPTLNPPFVPLDKPTNTTNPIHENVGKRAFTLIPLPTKTVIGASNYAEIQIAI